MGQRTISVCSTVDQTGIRGFYRMTLIRHIKSMLDKTLSHNRSELIARVLGWKASGLSGAPIGVPHAAPRRAPLARATRPIPVSGSLEEAWK
jgi:hypothetical protein